MPHDPQWGRNWIERSVPTPWGCAHPYHCTHREDVHMSDDDFEDYLDTLDDEDDIGSDVGEDSTDGNPYYAPLTDPINVQALAAVTGKLPVDDQLLRSIFIDLETIRSMFGPKDEMINRTMGDLESSVRTLVLGWTRQPIPFVSAIYRAADPVTRGRIITQLRALLVDLES